MEVVKKQEEATRVEEVQEQVETTQQVEPVMYSKDELVAYHNGRIRELMGMQNSQKVRAEQLQLELNQILESNQKIAGAIIELQNFLSSLLGPQK